MISEHGMNRHQRRAAAASQTPKRTILIALAQIDNNFDIQVDAKGGHLVMIFANATGCKIVEDVWPDVEWTTDDIFAQHHSPDWLFTHVRVTKLPPAFEEKTPLAFASPDAIGFAVAITLQQLAEPRRVAHYSGQGDELKINVCDGVVAHGVSLARSFFVEHVPAEPLSARRRA